MTTWKNIGPVPPAVVAAPPVPSLISTYILSHDGKRPLYFFEPHDDKHGSELWAFEGGAWKCITPKRAPRLSELEGGGWDPTRNGLVAFGFDYSETWVPEAVLVSSDGSNEMLTFTGDFPVTENDDAEPGSFDARGVFVFDPTRSVWVCFTRLGIWELDSKNVWSKVFDNADKSIPAEWSNETGLAVFDPVSKRVFFHVQTDSDGYPQLGFFWDGKKLESVAFKGLPKLTIGFSDPAFQIGAHPKHGVVLHLRGELFALDGKSWTKVPTTSSITIPGIEHARTVFDPVTDTLFIGPGKHEKAGNELQQVMFLLKKNEWSSQGTIVRPSELAKSGYGRAYLSHGAGAWLATSTHSLRTWKRENDAWNEIVDDKKGDALTGNTQLQLVTTGKHLVAVTNTGVVLDFNGSEWKALNKKDANFKERRGWSGAFDGERRLIVWGGEIKNRKSNETLFFENGKWRAAKKPSPQPADFKHGKDGVYVEFHLVWDSALGCMLRFGFEDVAALGPDDIWVTLKVKDYTKSVTSRGEGHHPIHDPLTGETLIVDLLSARILRFDLAGCVEVAKFEYPKELQPLRQHDKSAFHRISESYSYDPWSRTLFAVDFESDRNVFSLELASAFEKARSLGARKLLAPQKVTKGGAPAAAKQVLYSVGKTKVPADQLLPATLVELVGVRSEEIGISKPLTRKPSTVPRSRVGGPAPAVAVKKWPKSGKTPMGFLAQIETGTLLSKYAAVAVFCSTEGEATNEEDDNAVVLLKANELAKTAPTPAGVVELPLHLISFSPAKIEVDEARAVALGAKDAAFGPVLEKFQASKLVQDENTSQKRGGLPVFLQGEVKMKSWKLVAQLDFDRLSVSKWWPEAGLAGCLYVFVKDDEKEAFAMWQYT